MINIEKIKRLIKDGKIKWSGHILTRIQQRGIKIKDIIHCITNGEIIEYYPDDYPFPSCLILGYSDTDEGIHVVCALGQDYVWMITAYYPDKNEWLEDLKTRRR
jgi:hypothetical protein